MADNEIQLIEGEEVLVRTRPAFQSFWVFIFGLLLTGVGPFIKEDPPLRPATGLLFAAVFLVIILRRWTNTYTLTNRRLMIREGLIARATYAITLSNVISVEIHQGFTLKLVRTGHVLVRSRVQDEDTIIIYGLVDPEDFKERLDLLVEENRVLELGVEQS